MACPNREGKKRRRENRRKKKGVRGRRAGGMSEGANQGGASRGGGGGFFSLFFFRIFFFFFFFHFLHFPFFVFRFSFPSCWPPCQAAVTAESAITPQSRAPRREAAVFHVLGGHVTSRRGGHPRLTRLHASVRTPGALPSAQTRNGRKIETKKEEKTTQTKQTEKKKERKKNQLSREEYRRWRLYARCRDPERVRCATTGTLYVCSLPPPPRSRCCLSWRPSFLSPFVHGCGLYPALRAEPAIRCRVSM